MAPAPAGGAPPDEAVTVRCHPPFAVCMSLTHPLTMRRTCPPPFSRTWQAHLAPSRPPPRAPEKLSEEWVADRRHQTSQFLDWMADGSLPDGVKFLSRAHGEDTCALALYLLEKALRSCAAETDEEPTGNPALWAILLTQQAHALQYSAGGELVAWEVAERPELWGVRAMHKRMRERQSQRMALERGSRAPRDTRTVGRGLGGAQRVRDLQAPTPPTHTHIHTHPPGPLTPPLGPCAQLADRISEDAPMRALRVDELGDDDAIKVKVGGGRTPQP